jgi:hypothetical protein
MTTDVTQPESGVIRFTRDGAPFTGFKISSSTRPDTAAVRKERSLVAAHIVRGTEIDQWRSAGFFEYDGRYLVGPGLEGRSLASCLKETGETLYTPLIRVSSAMTQLARHGIALEEFDAASIYLLDDGGVLFLPADIGRRHRSCLSEQERRGSFDELNHPDIRDHRNISFALAVIVYRILAGKPPFESPGDETIENVRERMRKKDFISVALEVPDLDLKAAEIIDSAMEAGTGPPDFSDWPAFLKKLQEGAFRGSVSPELQRKRKAEAERAAVRGKRRRNLFRFFREYRVHLLVTAVVLAVVGSLAGTVLKNALAAPVTRGLSPREVVELFYSSINTFDHAVMEDCVTGDAGKGYIREAITLFVISRMREGYEHRQPYIDVNEWMRNGKAEIPEGKSLYGIAGLEITEKNAIQFQVEFRRWTPIPSDADSSAPVSYTVEAVKELVRLKELKGVYRIYSIETLSRQDVDP